MSNANAFFGTLGLAMRSGQIVTGEPKTRDLISAGSAALAVLDAGASENTAKTLRDKCSFYNVPLYRTAPGLLGSSIGKPACICIGIRKGGLGTQLLKKVVENEFDGIYQEP
ncbi:MAG: ribosomal L7Ae/L30e/S12e/Gadd45 family protein [Clostridia bacterium]|nr:ribosomal L7Ae/L30e/S12e/Gadd45 family protein [Clostridia bacterium]